MPPVPLGWYYLANTITCTYMRRFKVSPQYPVHNPRTLEVLLYQVLIGASTCLAVLVGVLCLLAWVAVSLSKQTMTKINSGK